MAKVATKKTKDKSTGNSAPPRRKRGPGRPTESPSPPRIDATPEMIAQSFFQSPPDHFEEKEYTCGTCGYLVEFPDVLFEDGDCSHCRTD